MLLSVCRGSRRWSLRLLWPLRQQRIFPFAWPCCTWPNGVNTSKWTPEGQGRDYKLSPTLEPLQDLKDQVLVVSNLWNAAANTGDGHYVKESSILTCTTISKTLGVDINMHGISMDQLAAQRIGDQTPLPSLELGHRTRIDGSRRQRRIYARLRLPHRVEQSDDAARPRDQSRARYTSGCSGLQVRKAIPRNRTHCCWIACLGRQRNCGPQVGAADRVAHRRISLDRPFPRSDGWNGRAIRSGIPGSRAHHWTPSFGPPMLRQTTPSTSG